MLGTQPCLMTSKQLYHLNLDGGNCELALAHPQLTTFIDYYWLLTIEQPTLLLEVIPDTAVDLVLSPDIPDFAALYFPVTKKFSIELHGPVRYVGVCFRSSTVSTLLRSEMSSLAKLSLGADIIQKLKVEQLLADIQDAQSLSYVAEIFDTFWIDRSEKIYPEPIEQPKINHRELIGALECSLGLDSIAGISNSLGVSERQFRRLSNDLFGISPKKLQNILRLQSALKELFQCESSQLQDLYYDDSHRIRELKRLTGCTPTQIRSLAEKYNNHNAALSSLGTSETHIRS